jgi:hypothetical protein
LLVTFNTGETKLFDARPYLEKGVFTKLKKPELFKQVYVAFDTVCWPGNLDIAPETLYDVSTSMYVNEDSPEYGAEK